MAAVFKSQLIKSFYVERPVSKLVVLKLLLGVSILVSLLSYSALDPNPFNLFRPVDGISNWLGLPGALLAGFLFDFFGIASYIIPVQLILLARRHSILQPKHFIPDLLEFLVLVSFISLVSVSLKVPTGIKETGMWGNVSLEALSAFPGIINALVILLIYQLVYFSGIRLDPGLFIITWIGALILVGILSRLAMRMTGVLRKSAKYGAIKWWSPLTMLIVRSSEKTRNTLKDKYLQTRQKLDDARLTKKVNSSADAVFGRKRYNQRIFAAYTPGRVEHEERMLTKVIKKYRETCYNSDSKAFLKLEEEI